jgi:cell division protease FtsH
VRIAEVQCPIDRRAHAAPRDESPAEQKKTDGRGRVGAPRSATQETPGWRVTPAPDGRGTPDTPWRGDWRRWLLFAVVLLAINYFAASRSLGPKERIRVPYLPTFVKQVDAGNVTSISSRGNSIQGDFKRPVTYPPKPDKDAKTSTHFTTHVPAFADTTTLARSLANHGVTVDAQPIDTGAPLWEKLLLGLLPTLLLIGLLIWFMRRGTHAAGGAGGMFGMGRAKPRRADPGQVPVTFDDVAGIDEAKAELAEMVDFLQHPDRYRRLGGRLPRGVLLTGPPGTGKTLLARAVAGQASVPFFTMSASEFIEMIVGVGASRVRDLFAQAKEAAPAIVFIDELDAIGRRRGGPGFASGGHDEREQTLNQILTEMDGFDGATGIVVLAATNRPDVLDAALLRPGRFDRRVHVAPPDRNGRRDILRIHTRSFPLADDVDLDRLAATTPGMVGADLANLANEAALAAARRSHDRVHMRDFTDSLERIVLGAARKLLMTEDDRRRTAYHEAGHALVGMLTAHADPVRKVSIIPRGRALGVTFSAPDADRLNYDEDTLVARIHVALAGRAAEELVFGNHTTGAESDLEQVTAITRHMVGRWGMSDAVGPLVALPAGEEALVPGANSASPDTLRLVDEEARRIATDAESQVYDLLAEHRDQLDALASALLEHETLDQHEAYEAARVLLDADRGASLLPRR